MKKFSLLLFLFAVASAPKQAPNVVLITVDTLRSDYLSCNGSKKVSTPHIDRLAKKGVNFLKARAQAPLTLPSHTSIITGQYPYNHGVRDNGTFHLAAGKETMAEVFKARGYHTAAFVGSFVLDHRFGLDQGFDHYDDRTWSNVSMLENPQAERDAKAVHQAFSEWLKNARSPFFAWVHFYDPHAPYNAPKDFSKRYPKDPYAAEVAYTDAVIGPILQEVEAHSPNTVIALAGDHGEGLGEHEEHTHSLLIYNSTIHVPMMLSAPGLIPAQTNVNGLVRLIDLAPTIFDYLGIPDRFGDGISLRGAIERKSHPPVTSYSESYYPRLNLGWSELRALEAGKYKYIHAPKPELYDLQADPGELKNLITKSPVVAGRMKSELLKLSGGTDVVRASESLDPEIEEKLRSLGYLSGTSASAASGADPKDKIGVWNDIQRAIALVESGSCAEADPVLKRILQKERTILLVYDYAASCAIKLEEWEAARQVLQQALKNGLDASAIRLNLGLVYAQQNKMEDAEIEFQKAIALQDSNVSAHYHLATLYRRMKKFDQAVEYYKRALKINPDYVFALNGLGMTYSQLGQEEQAVATFQKAVKVDSSNAAAFFNLAVQLERMGRTAEALDHYKKFLLMPESRQMRNERERAQEAVQRFGRNP